MASSENIEVFAKAFSDAWLHWSLNADNPAQYLNHPDAKEPNEYRYFPAQLVRGTLRWDIGNLLLKGPESQFTIPQQQIVGVFINTKALRFMVAMKEPSSYWADSDQEDQTDPFDRYSLKDYDFRLPYTSQVKGKPVLVFDKSIINALNAEL